jgi:2-oxoacid:acceptor oxidoreductase gamma subunit (pyruvate/2-ketoisovalerate family)
MNTYMAMWDRVVGKYSGEYGPYFDAIKEKTGLQEVTLIGRAGEGVWVTGELLAATAIDKGKFSKVIFAMPGERRNSPTRSFLRFADVPIHFPASWIHQADDMLIMEEEMLTFSSPVIDLEVATMTRRMKPGGFCIVNSPRPPEELKGDIAGRPVTVDATKISIEYLNNPFFMNMAMVGAYLAVRKHFSLEDVEKTIRGFVNPRGHKIFEGRKGEMNIKALRVGYESVKVERSSE